MDIAYSPGSQSKDVQRDEVSLTQPSDLALYVIIKNSDSDEVTYEQIGLINNLFIDVGRSKVPIYQFGKEDQIGYIKGFRNVYGELQMVQIELDVFAKYYQQQKEVITAQDMQFYKGQGIDTIKGEQLEGFDRAEDYYMVQGFTADMLNGIDIMVQSQPRLYMGVDGKRYVEYIQQKIKNFQIVSDSYASSVSGLFTARQIQFYADSFEPLTRIEEAIKQ